MHQEIDYETAMRGTNTNSYREYVSKRACASLLLTIATFIFIIGYFVGIYVSERNQQLCELFSKRSTIDQFQLSREDFALFKEMNAYQKSKGKLLSSAQTLSKIIQEDEIYQAKSLNTEIFNKYISCTQDIPPNTNMEVRQFIKQLVENAAVRQRDCLRIIQTIIDNHLANG